MAFLILDAGMRCDPGYISPSRTSQTVIKLAKIDNENILASQQFRIQFQKWKKTKNNQEIAYLVRNKMMCNELVCLMPHYY